MDRFLSYPGQATTEMRRVTIPDTDVEVSRFIFGTAALHHLRSTSRQAKLLDAAADAGFSHFDTAPYYGFGIAEDVLGRLLARRRELTVTTKVGLYAPWRPARFLLEVKIRKAAGKVISGISKPVADWHVARAKKSLDDSLTRLRRDHVDLLLLHEPEPNLIQTDEWLSWLERERGRVAAFGVSGECGRVSPFVEENSPLAAVVQTQDSVSNREADFLRNANRRLQLTYGYVSSAKSDDVVQALEAALRRNNSGAILVSTRSIPRLNQYQTALDRADQVPTPSGKARAT